MTTYHFDLIIDRDMTSASERQRLSEGLGDGVSPVVWNGAPALTCAVDAGSLPEAVLSTVQGLEELGVEVHTVQVAPAVFVA